MNDYLQPKDSTKFFDSLSDLFTDIEFIKKRKYSIGNIPCVFDIETTSFQQGENKMCCMYAFVFGMNGRCILGRTWDEFISIINRIIEYYDITSQKRIIIYVHNLSFEFQFFRHYFEWEKVFALEERKPIYAITTTGIEFRCSYLLSGYSLEVLGKNLTKYKVNKKTGDLDYKLYRHNKTILTDEEKGYILNDGLVPMAYIQEEIERLGDITKIPLTKTGYVRNLCKERCLKGDEKWNYSKMMKSLTLEPDDYKQMKRAFAGGFTHANAYYVDRIIENVHSYDFTSSYPAVMLSEKFPMSKPYRCEIEDKTDFLLKLKSYCCIFDIEFDNIRSISSYENYISYSRCNYAEHYILNNGRIIEADRLSITITEQDFFIISTLYKWDSISISNFKYMYKDYLPKSLIQTILDLYVSKTELKGVPEKEAEYLISKGMINSCYGMCVTDICRDEISYTTEWKNEKVDLDSSIEKYNKDKQRFLYYPWGVWVTAYARRNLFSGINEFRDDYIYSDTDSLKVLNIENHKDYIEKYNKDIQKKIRKCLKYYNISLEKSSPKTIKGESKPLGVWDYEGMYTRFKTLGAKRYIVEENDDIFITIAGVSKTAGKVYLKNKFGTNKKIFDSFNDELYFPAHYKMNGEDCNGSGKLCHTYLDEYMCGELTDYLGVTETYCEYSGVHLENTDYTLSLDIAFKNLIMGIKENCML